LLEVGLPKNLVSGAILPGYFSTWWENLLILLSLDFPLYSNFIPDQIHNIVLEALNIIKDFFFCPFRDEETFKLMN
jgi:hypothetical protein